MSVEPNAPAGSVSNGPSAQEFRSFWTGPPLSAYEELSLRSLLTRGQRVLLYSYDPALQVPDGVELLDANGIVPGDRIHEFVHANGDTSPIPHADLFRYELLRRFGGWYCDLDIVLIAEAPPGDDMYVAREDEIFANTAVLRFPPNAPVMVAAAAQAPSLMQSTQWGASAPRLMTRLLEEHGLASSARAWTAAYPVRPTEVMDLFLSEHRERLEQRVAGADFVHLWNQIWRRVRIPKDLGPPEGSFLDALFRKFDVRIAPGARMSEQAVRSWFNDYLVLQDVQRASGQVSTMSELAHALDLTTSERDRLRRLPASIAEVEAALLYARWERDELLQSTSWRVTAPLRGMGRRLRGLLRPSQ